MTRKDYIRLAEVLNTQFNRRHESATSLGMAIMDHAILKPRELRMVIGRGLGRWGFG